MSGERKLSVKELSNGLKVGICQKRDLPLLSLMVLFRVGAADEPPGKSGLAHLLEHMMFNGSANFPDGEFDRMLESLGGYSNAFTSYDYTGYYEIFPPSALEKVLEMEKDRLEALVLERESFQKEKNVVLEERKLTVENSPEGLMEEILNYISFLEHPYRRPIIGSSQDLKNISLYDLREFYLRYSPEKAVVVLAGDIDVEEGINFVEEYLGGWMRESQPGPVLYDEPFMGPRRVTIKRKVDIDSYMLSFRAGNMTDKTEFFSLSLLPYLLTETLISRLNNVLVEEKKVASSVVSWYEPRLGPSLFYVYAEAEKNVEGENLAEELKKELYILKENLKEDEFQTALARFSLDEILRLQRVTEIAEALAKGILFWDEPSFCLTIPDKVRELNIADFRENIAKIFVEDNLSEVILKNG